MAAKRIIILDVIGARVKYALRAAVPGARRQFYARPGKLSAWKYASASENADLQDGSVAESIGVDLVDANQATMKALLQSRWQTFQDEVSDTSPFRANVIWDGSWSDAGES